MDKLPPTPQKPPQSSSSSLNPSSLPPRPPPPQIRPIISILPALPMAHHQKQQRKFPAQGIGRGGGLQGHASLPPKPGIPGKPLPRDTGPIVLTGGKDNDGSGVFSYSHVSKRSYSSAAMTKAESPPTARREPVMTALAPASQARITTSPVQHNKQPVAATITPPAEMMARPLVDQLPSLISHVSDSNDVGARLGDQVSSQQTRVDSQAQASDDLTTSKPCTESVYPSILKPEISQQPNFLSFPHPNFYEGIQESSFHPNRNINHTNGQEIPINNGPLSDGYPSYVLPHPTLPPHPHSHAHHMHLQHHQGFIHHGPHDPYSFPNSMTPPNTGTMFAPPPPFQPHGAFDSSNQTSEKGGSTNPQTPFTPTHPFPVHLDLQHQHPHMSIFPLPPDNMVHFNNPHHEQHPQENQTFESALEASQGKKSKPSAIENNSLLRSISFFPPDSDQRNETATGRVILPTDLSNTDLKTNHHNQNPAENRKEQSSGFESQADISHGSVFGMSGSGMAAAHRLQSYSLGYYLSDKLSDVRLLVNRVGGTFDWNFEEFSAHSFILGRSVKLAGLIEDQIKSNEEQPLKSSGEFEVTWADEMENGRKDDHCLPIIAPTRKVTVLLETSDKYINRDSFLLSLRWLYGGADWELDAYLDPSHPKHRTLEWARIRTEKPDDLNTRPVLGLINPFGQETGHQGANKPTEPITLENIIQDTKSEEVRMLDRSIALLATGTLLGIDEITEKGAWGVRRWGMRLEGGAFERLLDFALDVNGGVDFSQASAQGVDGPGARYRMFTKHLLDEAVAFIVKSLPYPFKFDSKAPASNYLVRLPGACNHISAGVPAPMFPVDRDTSGSEKLRQVYSTILLSVPFDLLRTILEHDGFATRSNDWKRIARYDIAKAVVHERERRRKYGFKVERERRASTCSGMNEAGSVDEHDAGALSAHISENEGSECENLHWEESVLCTFGHGGNGLEITRRRKGGGVGGRVLWKVGDSPVKT